MGGRIEAKKGQRYFLKNMVVKSSLFGEVLYLQDVNVPFFMNEGQDVPAVGSRVSLDFIIRRNRAQITHLRMCRA